MEMDALMAVSNALADSVRQQPVAAVLLSLLIVAVTTRIWSARAPSGNAASVARRGDDAKPPPAVPYWLPIIGHLPQMALGSTAFLAGLRKRYPQGIFVLNLGGSSHAIIFRPELGTPVLNKPDSVANGHANAKRLMRSNFGWPSKGAAADARLDAMAVELVALYHKTLMTEPVLAAMTRCTLESVCHNAGQLVTFNQAPVDQAAWERAAGARVVVEDEGDESAGGGGDGLSRFVEVDLLDLVRHFVLLNSNASLLGTDFMANFPDFWEDFWTFDDGFLVLALAGPLAPWIPSGARARAARARLLASIREWERALDAHFGEGRDPGPTWQDLDNVSVTIHARVEIYRRLGLSIAERAASELGLIWGLSANASPLVFWIVLRLFADPGDILRRVREEIAPHVVLAPPLPGFGTGVVEAPVLERVDVEALMERCPLLKAAYIESLRLDVSAWSIKAVYQDFDIAERVSAAAAAGDSGGSSGGSDVVEEKFHIPKGSFVHVAHDLHHTDPARWEDPEVWRPERHIRRDTDGKLVADMGTVRPYGGGVTMCKGRAFAAREVLLFTAVIVTLWDIKPAGGGAWKMPKHGRAAGTLRPVPSPKVWVRRREV